MRSTILLSNIFQVRLFKTFRLRCCIPGCIAKPILVFEWLSLLELWQVLAECLGHSQALSSNKHSKMLQAEAIVRAGRLKDG